jgi:hypothetical protein
MRRIVIGLAALVATSALPGIARAFESPEAQSFELKTDQREAQRFVRTATGRLVISADGTATEIEIEAGEPRIEALYRGLIAGWRFEPILRDGAPAAVPVDMNLMLWADRVAGSERQVRYGVADVLFLESTKDDGGDVELLTSDFKTPRFPMSMAAAGVGASITLLLQVDDAGRVTRAAVSEASLFARQATSSRSAASKVETFTRAVFNVVDEWNVGAGADEGRGWVLVPVHFAPPGTTSMDWTPVLPMTVSRPEWMAGPMAEAKALSSTGRAVDEQVRLLTPLNPALN